MEKIFDLQLMIKAAAVSGIAFLWSSFTVEALKTALRIVLYSPENRKPAAKERVMCEECHEYFFDDLDELKHGKLLCEACRDENPKLKK